MCRYVHVRISLVWNTCTERSGSVSSTITHTTASQGLSSQSLSMLTMQSEMGSFVWIFVSFHITLRKINRLLNVLFIDKIKNYLPYFFNVY